jgi:diguanylate cyclase (GGDEF)-like protein/putative nucleotidyltransferase with HDIG domain
MVPVLEFVDSAMPAITIMSERFIRAGRTQQLEEQLSEITESAETLSHAAEIIGSVAAVQPTLGHLPADQLDLLKDLARSAAATVEEVRANRTLMEAHLHLQEYTSRLEHAVQVEREHATRDALTGLINHRGALQAIEDAFAAASQDDSHLALLLGDIDSFKLFNDTYGHVMGDEVLKLAARACREAVEPAGTVCRYGGDEFLIILPGRGKPEAVIVAQHLAARLGKAEFRTTSGEVVPIRMSLGVAAFPQDASTPSKLIAVADTAMYEAKKRARVTEGSAITSQAETAFGVLEGLILAIDAKDRYTKDHCDIVAEYAVKLATRMNLSEESKRALRIAGLLHDIGKLAIPDEILKKPGYLTKEEYEVVRRHVRIGEVLIREVPQLKDVLQAVSCHHERFDGSGYPRGLAGDQIPLLGRIIAIADSYSAMCLDRPYRKAMPHDHILRELLAGSGSQFDPNLSRTFVELLLEEQLHKQHLAA